MYIDIHAKLTQNQRMEISLQQYTNTNCIRQNCNDC